MPFSHHSHSGQFCPGHAKNTLEEVIQAAIGKSMKLFALTEHMPRRDEDRYPEEIELGWDFEKAQLNERSYFQEAVRLRDKYQSEIGILIGFESEWIRPGSLDLIDRSIQTYNFDFFVGSVHHVHTIPIDFDRASYQAAREMAGGSDEQLFGDYFDAQLAMLQATKPPVIGHFDLIRLYSDNPEGSFKAWPDVWGKITRNLKFIVSYGGLVEINCASLRKGMSEPYPKDEICQVFLQMKGRVCLSDDSHGVEHVALNYNQCLPYLERNHVSRVHFLQRSGQGFGQPFDRRFPMLGIQAVTIEELLDFSFYQPFR